MLLVSIAFDLCVRVFGPQQRLAYLMFSGFAELHYLSAK